MGWRTDDYAAMPGLLPDNAVGFTRRVFLGFVGCGYRIHMIFRIHRMGKTVLSGCLKNKSTTPGKRAGFVRKPEASSWIEPEDRERQAGGEASRGEREPPDL